MTGIPLRASLLSWCVTCCAGLGWLGASPGAQASTGPVLLGGFAAENVDAGIVMAELVRRFGPPDDSSHELDGPSVEVEGPCPPVGSVMPSPSDTALVLVWADASTGESYVFAEFSACFVSWDNPCRKRPLIVNCVWRDRPWDALVETFLPPVPTPPAPTPIPPGYGFQYRVLASGCLEILTLTVPGVGPMHGEEFEREYPELAVEAHAMLKAQLTLSGVSVRDCVNWTHGF